MGNPPWGEFLEARLQLIDAWDQEGKPAEEILAILSMDIGQVRLLILTARDERAKTMEEENAS